MSGKIIYQFAANTPSPAWTDISKETFDEYSKRGEWLTRALLTAPVVERQESSKLDELTEFGKWTIRSGRVLGYQGWREDFVIWQARACLDKVKEINQ